MAMNGECYCGNCGTFLEADFVGGRAVLFIRIDIPALSGGQSGAKAKRPLCNECAHHFGEEVLHQRPLGVAVAPKIDVIEEGT